MKAAVPLPDKPYITSRAPTSDGANMHAYYMTHVVFECSDCGRFAIRSFNDFNDEYTEQEVMELHNVNWHN